ncbi:jun dimerization protein 2-like [Synchiropus picturatus]
MGITFKTALMQRSPLFKIYSRPSSEHKKGLLFQSGHSSVVADTMPGRIPDPSVTAGSLPSLGAFSSISPSLLTTKLKCEELQEYRALLPPLHLLHSFGKTLIKTEAGEDEERRKRRREKNKVAAARCRNKRKERTDYLQKESERLETLNSDLKSQIEELKVERQQLILLLNRHRPTCIVSTEDVRAPESEGDQVPQLHHESAGS